MWLDLLALRFLCSVGGAETMGKVSVKTVCYRKFFIRAT